MVRFYQYWSLTSEYFQIKNSLVRFLRFLSVFAIKYMDPMNISNLQGRGIAFYIMYEPKNSIFLPNNWVKSSRKSKILSLKK